MLETSETLWEGHKKICFTVGGRESFIVCPEKPLAGSPWVWRTEFFGAFDTVDRALLEKGWFLAYHRVSDMYGCPASVEMMKEFYDCTTENFALHKKPALFGFSRGGLYAANFALRYPECCGVLYLDAPVLDIRSWPGGLGHGEGAPSCWEECKRWYGLSEESAAAFDKNPLDRAEQLAGYDIPVIIVCGDADITVPHDENALPFYERFRKISGKTDMIIKPGCGHHPHSLDEPTPVTDFIEKYY